MEVNLVAEGIKFMVLGMGTVFLFLIIMICLMNIQTKIIDKFFSKSTVNINKNRKIAAITAAIIHHKKVRGS